MQLDLPALISLVTHSMMQHRPNPMELRSLDSYIQILCRFQKWKWKVPSPSLLSNEKSLNPKFHLLYLQCADWDAYLFLLTFLQGNICKWRISATNGEKIILNITHLDIPPSHGCHSDFLEIRDGYWHRSELLSMY